MNFEIIGTLASVIVLISFTFKSEKKIRVVNIIGAILFVVYGALNGSFAVWFLNAALILIHLYKLLKK